MQIEVDGVGYETDEHPVVLLDSSERKFNFQKNYVIAVSQDQNSQLLTISVPRYYDGIDLSAKTAKVEYCTSWVDSEGKISSGYITLNPTLDGDDRILYPWVLTQQQTFKPGKVYFALRWVYMKNDNDYSYIFRTQPGVFSVVAGIDDLEIYFVSDEIAELRKQVDYLTQQLANKGE